MSTFNEKEQKYLKMLLAIGKDIYRYTTVEFELNQYMYDVDIERLENKLNDLMNDKEEDNVDNKEDHWLLIGSSINNKLIYQHYGLNKEGNFCNRLIVVDSICSYNYCPECGRKMYNNYKKKGE